ncbi:mannitol dehydrogenase family protein [Micropruina sonneratiae]|uniref:mannitol dehydrogenase family protein n=1 Tax=Micropruina sonneratiae TaxID=2986940 RepID=UPI0022275946|nr:mannitol dehydrogenase family protein [Micropruina sp. KQZ13P-5]MCW3158366.1 mannitol dehydrogenase family protein [Micropruina sp. KQZ13P-5]
MTIQPLSRASLTVPVLGASAPPTPGMLHLGIGNFHRAHAAVYTAKAMAAQGGDWGIVAVANRNRRVVDALAGQDHLYSILELSSAGERADVMDVHRETMVAAEQTTELMARIADPAIRIVTLTISENGYCRNAVTGDLDVDGALVSADLANPDAPRTTIGQLAGALIRRYQGNAEPITILSCDNLVSAGHTAHKMVSQYLQATATPDGFHDWFAASVTFPNAMVDRIVPGTTDATRARVRELLGVVDAIPVPAERFSMWVIEDRFAAGRPAWEEAGAIFSDEVEAYELVKLRLLNGSHSLIAYLGGLSGAETIPASFGQDFVRESVTALLNDEYLPSIELPSGFDPQAYIAELFDRWSNHALGDATARVGSDGSLKLLQRVPDPALRLLGLGEVPQQLSLMVAGWIACVAPPAGFAPGPIADAMVEPARERLAEVTAVAGSVRAHVEGILRGGFFPDALAASDVFVARVAELLDIIVSHGVQDAARAALDA